MANLIVVRLDDAKYPGGPGTVLEVTEPPIPAILARYTDRDGARDPSIRIGLGFPSIKPGDRVEFGGHGR